ncbi:MAG: ATP-dependent Lon protease [Polaribacter sp.]|jgi:ATP-dependent Lon protease
MFEELFYPKGIENDAEFMPIFSIEDDGGVDENETYPESLPVLALKNTVLFPGVITPITVGRDKSIKAINKAYEENRLIAVMAQKDDKAENPQADNLYEVGTVAKIIKLLRMPDGTATAILHGRRRCLLREMTYETPFLYGKIDVMDTESVSDSLEFDALVASIKDMAKEIIDLSPNIPSEANVMLSNIKHKTFLLHFIASNLSVNVEGKQKILEENDLNAKAESVMKQMDGELRILELRDKIENKVRGDIEKQQKDYFLNQQLKTIQEELGQNPQEEEIKKLMARAKTKSWNETVEKVFLKEIAKVKRINPQVAEYSVMLNYLELMLDLPWDEFTEDNFDLKSVKAILDKDHYGLEDVKERILEHLAVLKLKGDMKAPIICLVGPPGVGKTSLGKSIAKALNREFIRMSLGGLRDESEIRGHRKTYIGAMPGRILQSLKKAKSSNPVFILDEIDKLGKDFRGDPSSALLEVLDPEQNSTFHDNYLDMEYDLSKVMFIATSNSLGTIQPALLDRMEVIEISGYSIEEKIEIAKRHLIPSQRKEHGLKAGQIKLGDRVIEKIIQGYTRESGVRSLSRQIASVMRNTAKNVAMEIDYNVSVKKEELKDKLGPTKFSRERYLEQKVSGVAVGLAWTPVGGDILFVEASLHPGKGNLILTGNLGDVMKESATAALSYLKANGTKYNLSKEDFSNNDIHIHVPEGAIPKDGPSAGITMISAITSIFIKKRVKPFLAMSGEITLRGKVLPVGGIKAKILAAKRAGIKDIILCKENEKNVAEINEAYIKGVRFHYVTEIEEVIDFALSL